MDSAAALATENVDEPARKRMRPDRLPDDNPEETVGITQFLSTHEGFDGIIKYRYSDFLVNEISSDGTVVRLTDLTCPEYDPDPQRSSTMDVILSDEIIDQLKTLSETRSKDKVTIAADSLTKEQRTSIHHFVRSIDVNLKSELIDGSIQVIYQSVNNQSRRSHEQWPDKTKPYLKFVLYKENRDTMDAIQCVAGCLNMNTSLFQYAGVKDKRGKTCQEVTIHKVLPSKFKHVNRRLSAIKVGNFRICDTPLRLGQLQGNRFEIFIRNVSTKSNEFVPICVENWIQKGFINYFGLQRFGSRTLATQTIGKYLLRHDWSLAIDAILTFDETISQEWLRNLLSQWNKTRDIKTILDGNLPYRRSIEVDLLRGLQKSGEKNLIGALSSIPRNTRLLYLHAYQSMIWNKIVSRRLITFGMDVLVGDLYLNETNDGTIQHVTEMNRTTIQLEQIVLPLPGYDIQYPSNEIHSWYRDLLNEDGINIEQMKYQIKDYSLPGDYRQFIVRPGQVEYRLVHYNNIDDDPLQSDYERLIGTKKNDDKESDNDKYTGLILAFSLPKSCYATMALREILHRNESQLQTHHHHQQPNEANAVQEEEENDDIEDVVL